MSAKLQLVHSVPTLTPLESELATAASVIAKAIRHASPEQVKHMRAAIASLAAAMRSK